MSGAVQVPSTSARHGLVTINTSRIRKALTELNAAITKGAFASATIAAKMAHVSAKTTRMFNDRTGGLRQSIKQGSFVGYPSTFVAAYASHARFVNDGTRPHEIRARNARALRFVMNGSVMFRARVMHPGTAPRPFMMAAFLVGWGALRRALNDHTNAAISRFNRGT